MVITRFEHAGVPGRHAAAVSGRYTFVSVRSKIFAAWLIVACALMPHTRVSAQSANRDAPSRLNEEGLHLLQQGHLEEAAEKFSEAIAADPKDISARSNLGVALRRQQRFAEAVAVLQAAVKLRPDDARILSNLGLAL